MTKGSLRLLVTLLVAGFFNSANAIPITWTLNGSIEGGGTAGGSFVFDTSTSQFSDISLTLAGLSGRLSDEILVFDLMNCASCTPLQFEQTTPPYLFTVTSALTLGGITLADLSTTESESLDGAANSQAYSLFAFLGAHDFVTEVHYWDSDGFSLTPSTTVSVPEPTTLALLGLGLAGLGLSRRRAKVGGCAP